MGNHKDDRHTPTNKRVPRVEASAGNSDMNTSNGALSQLAFARLGNATELYREPLLSNRSGPLFNAFSYPTKISAESIALFIAAHTEPGDTVLDVFAGSGTTGIAARLCDAPTPEMIKRAKQLNLKVTWGPRHAVLYEISTVGALLARVLCDPPSPTEFNRAARALLSEAEDELGWLYAATDPSGQEGQLRHIVWTDVLLCDNCQWEVSYWDAAVQVDPARFLKDFVCQECGLSGQVANARRKLEETPDPVTGEPVLARARRPARVYGKTGKTNWQRTPVADDLNLLRMINEREITDWYPTGRVQWGDLYRSGYHQGIERYDHFYTRRNLMAIARLWSLVENQPTHLHDSLRLWILSFNATHSTLMTRVVAKSRQRDLALTGAQSGVLYVSSLPVEKNVFEGLRRKVQTFASAFGLTVKSASQVQVVNASSTRLSLNDRSVSYVFTDPPFGSFIPYAELNQVNEAWLDAMTDSSEEAIVSPAQGKGVGEYQHLLTSVFTEVRRVMKDDALATVVFHSSKPEIWEAISHAMRSSRLAVREASVLDKTQVTFKQVVSQNSSRGDALMLVLPADEALEATKQEVALPNLVDALISAGMASGSREELSPERLYSRYVGLCMTSGNPVRVGTADFQRMVQVRLDA